MNSQNCVSWQTGVGFIIDYRWASNIRELPGTGWARVRTGPGDLWLWRRFRVHIGPYREVAQ
jgi:hypothetical protein